MNLTIPVLGLLVIICGWVLQLIHAFNGRKEINKYFVILYVVGCIALTYDSYVSTQMDVALMNLGCVVLGTAMLVVISGR